jgi:hypothetical protein
MVGFSDASTEGGRFGTCARAPSAALKTDDDHSSTPARITKAPIDPSACGLSN